MLGNFLLRVVAALQIYYALFMALSNVFCAVPISKKNPPFGGFLGLRFVFFLFIILERRLLDP